MGNTTRKYAILNLDTSGETGSHWVAYAREGPSVHHLYDSFGRMANDIVPMLTNKLSKSGIRLIHDTEDAEQMDEQEDCGARSLAYLYAYEHFGHRLASSI